MIQSILSGHTTPETAYVVEDYPYGFRLRCKIRYWLEYVKGRGYRLCSQTTNPKRGEVWNKEKKSTFSRFGGVMFLDENSHVQWEGLSEYDGLAESEAFLSAYGHTLPEDGRQMLEIHVQTHKAYEAKKAEGKNYLVASREAIAESVDAQRIYNEQKGFRS